ELIAKTSLLELQSPRGAARVNAQRKDVDDQINALYDRKQELDDELAVIDTGAAERERVEESFQYLAGRRGAVASWPFEHQRTIIGMVFGFGDNNTTRKQFGIFVTKHPRPGKKPQYSLDLRGRVDLEELARRIAEEIRPGKLGRPRVWRDEMQVSSTLTASD
ncbi:MAG TPA: hypothetical protein VN326_25650, partial [Casimicrobiaceae bacterium]|nr:hypothetical protein [Casimicrobiaceae bacterium]